MPYSHSSPFHPRVPWVREQGKGNRRGIRLGFGSEDGELEDVVAKRDGSWSVHRRCLEVTCGQLLDWCGGLALGNQLVW